MRPLAGSSGAYPYERGKHVLGSFYVYADESGDEVGQPDAAYCILAGFMGSPRQWTMFNRAWERILLAYSVPELHSKELFQPEKRKHTPYFANWNDAKTGRFLAELLAVINARSLFPIAVALDLPSWKSLEHDERQWLSGGIAKTQTIIRDDGAIELNSNFLTTGAPQRPILSVFQAFVGKALLAAKPGVKIHFVFDRQNALETRTVETLAEQFKGGHLRPELESKVGTIAFADSLTSEPIQAADLYAYFWNRAMNDAVRGPLLKQAAEAFSGKKYHLSHYDRRHLMAMIDSSVTDIIENANRLRASLGHPPIEAAE